MVTKHKEVCDSDDIQPYAEAFDVDNPKVHEDIFWCNECENELSVMMENGRTYYVV